MSGASANPARGEVRLVLGDAAFVLRPSYAALVAAEQDLGSLFALIERSSSGHLNISELVSLFWHCLASDADRPERDAFGQMLLQAGLAQVTPAYRDLVRVILAGA